MLSVFGDESGELGTLADYYGVALQDSKDCQALRYVKDIQGETEEDSVKAKEKLIEYCGTLSLPVTDELDCMKYINQRLEDFDLQYRTVDGVVCSTRDSADFAREELQALQAFFGEIAPPTSESLLDYEADLLAGNALDNAMEAALQAEDKRITVRCRVDKGLFMLRVENAVAGEVDRKSVV